MELSPIMWARAQPLSHPNDDWSRVVLELKRCDSDIPHRTGIGLSEKRKVLKRKRIYSSWSKLSLKNEQNSKTETDTLIVHGDRQGVQITIPYFATMLSK